MMPLSDFPDDLKPESGLVFEFETPNGQDILGTVLAVKDGMAEVDFNHPLAGQLLVFTVEVLDINNARAGIIEQ
jgi:FKBP-type peptidyl-prolyl cis-trans isomerase SlpA